ncbi:MAG TPA: L,D-transpeptidase, partial [Ktedonobacteraceae bacterium]
IYQQQYTSSQQALTQSVTNATYTKALTTLQGQVLAIKIPTLQQEAKNLQQKLQQQVSTWGSQHTYKDSYNGKTYTQDYEYNNSTGIGGPLWLQEDLATNKTLADWQQTIENLNMWLYNFQEFQTNFGDKTPSTQSHQTDLALMQHYNFMQERVVVVSLSEQTLRAYDNGKLVKTFQVVTGQPDLPSPPGNWWFEGKQHPTVFKSSEPKGSPDWYPDTKINYAMQYHSNGYFFHDAWWRTQFGAGANYPHQDPDGDPFAGQGSHGCVNMSTNDSAWLYGFVSVYTQIVIY